MRKIIYVVLLCIIAMQGYSQNLSDTTELMNTLRAKEQELNAKEADLNAREVRLSALEKDLIKREENIVEMRDEVTKKLDELEVKQDGELDKLAKIYQASKPKSAAAILTEMELDKTVALFRRMTPSVAGKILNEMAKSNAEYASKLTAALTPEPAFDNKTP